MAENGKPIIATLHRAIDGKPGRQLLTQQRQAREQLTAPRDDGPGTGVVERTALAHATARNLGLTN